MLETDVERRRREDARNRENRARLAFAYARYDSDGLGHTQFSECASFGLTFIEEPYVSTGHVLDLDALADSLGLDAESDDVPIPHVTSYVVDWDQDDRGFYVGAFAACVVTFPPDFTPPPDLVLTINHHFTFAAVALKDVPVGGDDTDDGRSTPSDPPTGA